MAKTGVMAGCRFCSARVPHGRELCWRCAAPVSLLPTDGLKCPDCRQQLGPTVTPGTDRRCCYCHKDVAYEKAVR